MRSRLAILLFVLLAGTTGVAADRGGTALSAAGERLASGDTLAAIAILERSHADPSAATLLGRLLRERGTIIARLESQRVLEDARRRHPASTAVEMELARTYLAQRFLAAAMACLRNVLEADPSHCDARYLLGTCHFQKWRRVNQYTDDAAAARRELRAAMDCDGGNADAAMMLLIAGYVLGDSATADADRWLERFPQRAEFSLFRGSLAFERGDYAGSARHFARGLALLPPDRRALYEDLSRVLDGRNAADYLDLSPGRQAVLSRGYWLAADPDATTELNERALEHVHRVFVADALFSSDITGRRGSLTDRGEVFVKFGPPLDIRRSLGDDPASGWVEAWSYALGGAFHDVLFVDEFLNGNPRIPRAADDELNFLRNREGESALPARVRPIAAELDVTVFRDDDLAASAYVAIEASAEALRRRSGVDGPPRLVARAALFDEAWVREGGFSVFLPEESALRDGGRIGVVHRMPLPFGRYHLAVALADDGDRARATARTDTDAGRFALDTLAVSDILLFDEAATARQAHVVERGGKRMLPRVGHRYGPGEAVHLYAEVYHLAATGGTARYDVRIAIHPAAQRDAPAWLVWADRAAGFLGFPPGEPAIAQQYRREIRGHTAHESIRIDVDALRPGLYDLRVEITDAANGARASSWTSLERTGGDGMGRK